MEEIVNRVLISMSSINRPQMKFIQALLVVLVSLRGKANFRNMSRYSNLCEKTYSRWFRKVFNFRVFNEKLIAQQRQSEKPLIGMIDATFLPKSGSKTAGLDWHYNGKTQRTEKGLEVSLIAVGDLETRTAYGLDARQTMPLVVKPARKGRKQSPGFTRVDLYLQQLDDSRAELCRLGVRHIAADGFYSKYKYIDGVSGLGFEAIGKLRLDADLKWLYQGGYDGVGRPRKFLGKVNLESDLEKMELECELDDGTKLYSACVYSVNFKRTIKIVYMKTQSAFKVSVSLIFSTDVELSAIDMCRYYKLRFQIEFIFRDAKQYTGLTDCQSTKSAAINTHINASVTALNCLKFEDQQTKRKSDSKVISIVSMVRVKTNQRMLKLVFSRLDLDQTCKKVRKVYEDLSRYGSIAA